jgi:hypothetical protein
MQVLARTFGDPLADAPLPPAPPPVDGDRGRRRLWKRRSTASSSAPAAVLGSGQTGVAHRAPVHSRPGPPSVGCSAVAQGIVSFSAPEVHCRVSGMAARVRPALEATSAAITAVAPSAPSTLAAAPGPTASTPAPLLNHDRSISAPLMPLWNSTTIWPRPLMPLRTRRSLSSSLLLLGLLRLRPRCLCLPPSSVRPFDPTLLRPRTHLRHGLSPSRWMCLQGLALLRLWTHLLFRRPPPLRSRTRLLFRQAGRGFLGHNPGAFDRLRVAPSSCDRG